MGRQYPEGLLFAAECQRMGKIRRGQISGSEILKRRPVKKEEEEEKKKKKENEEKKKNLL
jgi:hypothetical protein